MSSAIPSLRAPRRRRAAVLVYSMTAMVVLCGVISLAVDWGRVQLTKTQLVATAEAAARAGAMELQTSKSAARKAAVAVGAANAADGQPIVIPNADVKFGNWSTVTKSFTLNGTPTNAVRVIVRRTAAKDSAVPLTFGSIIGMPEADITVQAIAFLDTTPVPSSVTNKSNPWLAGMPAGTTANAYDSAPSASPTLLISSGLVAGAQLQFASTGKTSNQEGVEQGYDPDGNLGWIIHNYWGAEHGLADLNAPISSLIGVFLSDAAPDTSSSPASLDFTSAASRDFSTLSPQLKQPFFIGDGLRSNGATQNFVVPAGATRLFVGSMDGQQWSDNAGGFSVTIKNGVTVYRVETVE